MDLEKFIGRLTDINNFCLRYESCSDCDSNNVPDVKYDLVLRQWCDLNPAAEFRCFVREKTLIGILLLKDIICLVKNRSAGIITLFANHTLLPNKLILKNPRFSYHTLLTTPCYLT